MVVKDVMSTDIVTINPESTLIELLEKYEQFRHHTLPVINRAGDLVGLVDLTDIMKYFMPHNPSLSRLLKGAHFYHGHEADILETEVTEELISELRVEDIMTNNIIPIEPHETVSKARSVMISHDINYMPVVDESRLVGVITLCDIIMGLFRNREVLK